MPADDNKQVVQRIFAELAVGNAQAYIDAMADDFTWTIAGSTTWSRAYAGKHVVVEELFGLLRSRIAGRIKTVAHRFIAEGAHVVVEARGLNVTRAGKDYGNAYCFVFRLDEGGKLRAVTEYMDTELATGVLGPP